MAYRAQLYPQMAKEDVETLYGLWGGRPRYVLEKAADASAQQQLESAIGAADLPDIVQPMPMRVGAHSGVSDRCEA